MASYTHTVAGATEITTSSGFYKLDIQINTRKDMWWKEVVTVDLLLHFRP